MGDGSWELGDGSWEMGDGSWELEGSDGGLTYAAQYYTPAILVIKKGAMS
jgi:hypothetical protein